MKKDVIISGSICLNPYSNGMKIELQRNASDGNDRCLNPYSNGMKIERARSQMTMMAWLVLILILME